MRTTRRSFLSLLASLPSAGLLELEPRDVAGRAHVPIHESHVAGFRYHHGPELIGRMRAGEAVGLAAEPRNPHDAFAVRIDYRGRKIGYLPRRQNRAVARLLWAGRPLRARIVELDPAEPWRAVTVEVLLARLNPSARRTRC